MVAEIAQERIIPMLIIWGIIGVVTVVIIPALLIKSVISVVK